MPVSLLRSIRQIGLLALLLALSGCAVAVQKDRAGERVPTVASDVPVLLVSLDGFRADYLQRGLTPNLLKLAATGVRAEWMTPSFPALTFPNHYTLITGLRPDRHGIVGGTVVDAEIPGDRFNASNRAAVGDPRWWAQGTPLWVTAQQAGLITSTLFWPGSEAPNQNLQPNDWLPYNKALSAADRIDTVLGLLARPATTRPRLLTLYLEAIDTVGHYYGPDSPELAKALSEVDAAMGRLLAGLRRQGLIDQVNLIVVSDHGMAAGSPDRVIVLDDVVPVDWLETQVVGEVAGFAAKPDRVADVEARLLRAHPNMQCWRKNEVPARFHYGSNPRILPLVCLANEGWVIRSRAWLQAGNRINGGVHGYDPQLESMRAIFIASGPAFPRNKVVPSFDNVEVYPLLAELLGIQPLPSDGVGDLGRRLPLRTPTP